MEGARRTLRGIPTAVGALLLLTLLLVDAAGLVGCTRDAPLPALETTAAPPPAEASPTTAPTLAPTATVDATPPATAAPTVTTQAAAAVTPLTITTIQPPPVHPAWSTWADINEIAQIAADGDILWMAARGGVVRLDLATGEATVYGSEHGLPGGAVLAIALADDGTVWCGTQMGVAWLDATAQRWNPVALDAAEIAPWARIESATTLLVDRPQDALWVTSVHGVLRCGPASLSGGAEPVCRPVEGLWRQAAAARDLWAEEDGTLWVGMVEGAVRYDASGAEPMDAADGGPPTVVQKIRPDHRGGLWFATLDGVYHLRQQPEGDLLWEHFGEDDGLVSGWVLSVLPLPPADGQVDGVVWFGTEGGISRYDPNAAAGAQWTTLSRGETPVGHGASRMLQVDAADELGGGLWFGTREGLWRLASDGWRHYDVAGGQLPSDRVTWLSHLPGRGLLVATSHGVTLYDGSTWLPLTIPARVEGNDIADLYTAPDGRLWLTRRGIWGDPGIARLEGDRFAGVDLEGAGIGSGSAILSFVSDGTLWLGGDDQMTQIDPNVDAVVYRTDCLPSALYQPLLVRSDGTPYFSSDSGLAYLAQGELMRTPIGIDFGSRRALCMLEDRAKAIWVGTDQEGAFRWEVDRGWTHYLGPDPEQPDRVMALAQSDDGAVWIGTVAEGVRRLDPESDQWTTYTTEDGLPVNTVWALLVDSQGNLWAGTPQGAAKWAGDRWEPIAELGMAIRTWAEVRLEAGMTQIWAGTDDGLWMQFEGGWLPCSSLSQIADVGGISAVWQQEDGTVWLAADAGLVRRRPDGSCRLYQEAGGVSLREVRSLLRTPDGTLWVGLEMGSMGSGPHSPHILRLDTTLPEEQERWITTANCGPAGEYVNEVFEDSRGQLWFPGMNGLSRLVNGEWIHEPADMLPEGRVHTLVEDLQGRLWAVGWTGAVALVDGAWVPMELPLPADQVIVQQVLVDHTGALWFSVSEMAHETAPGGAVDQGSFLWRWDGSAWRTYNWASPTGSTQVAPAILLEQGDPPQLWAVNDLMIAQYDGTAGEWVPVAEPESGREGMPSSAMVARDGSLWLGQWDQGVWRLRYDATQRTARWEQFTFRDGLAGNNIQKMAEDQSGTLWFVTDAGLSRYEE